MCDILAPLLVILQEEYLAYSCFKNLMVRMNMNFPHGGLMDNHFANMRSLIQILDSELFDHMHQVRDQSPTIVPLYMSNEHGNIVCGVGYSVS